MLQKHGHALLGLRCVFRKFFLKEIRYLFDIKTAVTLLPHKAAISIQGDLEIRCFQSRQQIFYQQSMAEFRLKQCDPAIAGGFAWNSCDWDKIEKVPCRLSHGNTMMARLIAIHLIGCCMNCAAELLSLPSLW